MTQPSDAAEGRTPTSGPSVVAASILALEAVAIFALAVWELVALAGGDVGSATSGIALVALAGVFGLAVLAFAVGVLRGHSWGRSGGIVTQLLILAVAFGAATGAYAHPLVALALAVPAVVGLVLLFLIVRRAAAGERKS